jgi:hypothetical protein
LGATRACPKCGLSNNDSFFKKDWDFFCWEFGVEVFFEDEFFVVKCVADEISEHELVVECQNPVFNEFDLDG